MLFNSALYGAFLLARLCRLLAAPPPADSRARCSSSSRATASTSTAPGTPRREQSVPLGPVGWSVLCLGVIFVGSTLDFFDRAGARADESPREAQGAAPRVGRLLPGRPLDLQVLRTSRPTRSTTSSASFGVARRARRTSGSSCPFGISFFTFETMSYTIDVYRRELAPADRYLDYLLFVCFFPHLVAGPIVRPRQMLPQLARDPVRRRRHAGARPLAHRDRASRRRSSSATTCRQPRRARLRQPRALLVARVRCRRLRLRRSDLLRLLRLHATSPSAARSSSATSSRENFDAPYLAANLQDFWHRWHISLSTWLRDYLYVPLGGSRGGAWKTYRNLMITMLLGGLWHGASWNFVIWGALHGGALAVTRMWQRRARRATTRRGGVWTPSRSFLTFQFVCFAWVFFRAPTFGHATPAPRAHGAAGRSGT